jgi:hypothetical protein
MNSCGDNRPRLSIEQSSIRFSPSLSYEGVILSAAALQAERRISHKQTLAG